jgi:hypothetical protein
MSQSVLSTAEGRKSNANISLPAQYFANLEQSSIADRTTKANIFFKASFMGDSN